MKKINTLADLIPVKPKYTITVEVSDVQENPCEDDGWKVYSFNRNHINFANPNDLLEDEDVQKKLETGYAFRLGYYEHGSSSWFLQGQGGPGTDCPWDGVRFAGLIVWENDPSEIGGETPEDREKDAERFLEIYTSWCNGEIYQYSIENHDGEFVDSCCGFYSAESMLEHIRDFCKDGEIVEVTGESAWFIEDEL